MVSNAEAQALELAHLSEPVRLAASAGAAFMAQWRREAWEALTTAGAAAEAALRANLAVLAAGDAAKAAHIAVKVAAAAANAAQQAHACEANPEVLGNETSSGGRSGADVTSDSQSSPSAESSGLAVDDPEQRALLRAIRLAELQAASDAAAAALQRAIDQAAAADAQVETAKTTVVTRTAEARVADAKYRACAAVLTAVNERLQLYVEPGVGHVETPGMWLAVRLFFDKYLLQRQVQGQAAHSAVQRNVQASLVIGSCDA
ncbi:hypothetical protein QJQ45_002022 [Haematococcus lacustris]|nr:hypothetical protein QJQ45_002022 [Haematococcus lacustris]